MGTIYNESGVNKTVENPAFEIDAPLGKLGPFTGNFG
jgi:hypothetical protein